jgi:hypothetical protein
LGRRGKKARGQNQTGQKGAEQAVAELSSVAFHRLLHSAHEFL